MRARLANKYSGNVSRQGLSILEFVGCIVALGGGVVLGSLYFGIDLQETAVDLLQRSQTVDLAAEENILAASEETLTAEGENQSMADSMDASEDSGKEETRSLEVGDLTSTQINTSNGAESKLSEIDQAKATQKYWHALVTGIDEEVNGRRASDTEMKSWRMFDHLSHFQERHQRAADRIQQLDDRGVDNKVTAHATQLQSWHLSGAELYQRALDLITDSPAGEFSGPFAQSWQSAATQHRIEGKLVQEKHIGVANYLAHTYKTLGPFKVVILP